MLKQQRSGSNRPMSRGSMSGSQGRHGTDTSLSASQHNCMLSLFHTATDWEQDVLMSA